MTKTKRFVSVALLSASFLFASATDVYVYSESTSTPVAQVNDIRSIVFEETGIKVHDSKGEIHTIAYENFDLFSFQSTDPTGIQNVQAEKKVEVFGITGLHHGTLQMDRLPAGIYLIKEGDKVKKILKK